MYKEVPTRSSLHSGDVYSASSHLIFAEPIFVCQKKKPLGCHPVHPKNVLPCGNTWCEKLTPCLSSILCKSFQVAKVITRTVRLTMNKRWRRRVNQSIRHPQYSSADNPSWEQIDQKRKKSCNKRRISWKKFWKLLSKKIFIGTFSRLQRFPLSAWRPTGTHISICPWNLSIMAFARHKNY